MSSTVLCVDPDDSVRAETATQIRQEFSNATIDVDLITAASIAEAREYFDDTYLECVITEYSLPDGTGLELLAEIRESMPDTAGILYTDVTYADIDTTAHEDVIAEYISKTSADATDDLLRLLRVTLRGSTQAPYPVSQNDAQRLSALAAYDLDVARAEESIDNITQLAAKHFDVPIASINIIHEHSQEFLICHGADWPTIDRKDSICTYTIVEDQVLTVEDTTVDPRFSDNEVLQELGIRAYMGATITAPSGLPIGTLCVYDQQPRSFSAADEEYLRLLAAVASEIFELQYHRQQEPSTDTTTGGDQP